MFPEGRIFEFLIVGAIALIVVGPKDLPVLMRKVGQFVARMRAMAAEFRASFDELARQSELEELRREVQAMRSGKSLETAVTGGGGEITDAFADIHTGLRDAGAQLHPPMSHQASPNWSLTGRAASETPPGDPLPEAAAPVAEATEETQT